MIEVGSALLLMVLHSIFWFVFENCGIDSAGNDAAAGKGTASVLSLIVCAADCLLAGGADFAFL